MATTGKDANPAPETNDFKKQQRLHYAAFAFIKDAAALLAASGPLTQANFLLPEENTILLINKAETNNRLPRQVTRYTNTICLGLENFSSPFLRYITISS